MAGREVRITLEAPQTREIRETAVRTLMVSRPQMTKISRKQEITI